MADDQPLVSAIIPTFNRRDEVIECVASLLASTYPRLEIIVVDNASTDGTADALEDRYGSRVRLIRSPVNLFAGGGRNRGAREAAGDYLLFVDSDNVADPAMVAELVRGMEASISIPVGLGGPFMYYHARPDTLTWLEGDINLWTSRTWWKGVGMKDHGQFRNCPPVEVGHVPNVFILPRRLFEEVGGIDPDYVIHYEESDLAEKIKRRGFRAALFPDARTFHKIPPEKAGDTHFAGGNPMRLYYSVRNRFLFMRKNTGGVRLAVFLVVFAPLFLAYNLLMLARHQRLDLASLVLRAHRDGLLYCWRTTIVLPPSVATQ